MREETLAAAFNDANSCTGACVYTATSGLKLVSDDSDINVQVTSMTLQPDGTVKLDVLTGAALPVPGISTAEDVYFTYRTATSTTDAKITLSKVSRS